MSTEKEPLSFQALKEASEKLNEDHNPSAKNTPTPPKDKTPATKITKEAKPKTSPSTTNVKTADAKTLKSQQAKSNKKIRELNSEISTSNYKKLKAEQKVAAKEEKYEALNAKISANSDKIERLTNKIQNIDPTQSVSDIKAQKAQFTQQIKAAREEIKADRAARKDAKKAHEKATSKQQTTFDKQDKKAQKALKSREKIEDISQKNSSVSRRGYDTKGIDKANKKSIRNKVIDTSLKEATSVYKEKKAAAKVVANKTTALKKAKDKEAPLRNKVANTKLDIKKNTQAKDMAQRQLLSYEKQLSDITAQMESNPKNLTKAQAKKLRAAEKQLEKQIEATHQFITKREAKDIKLNKTLSTQTAKLTKEQSREGLFSKGSNYHQEQLNTAVAKTNALKSKDIKLNREITKEQPRAEVTTARANPTPQNLYSESAPQPTKSTPAPTQAPVERQTQSSQKTIGAAEQPPSQLPTPLVNAISATVNHLDKIMTLESSFDKTMSETKKNHDAQIAKLVTEAGKETVIENKINKLEQAVAAQEQFSKDREQMRESHKAQMQPLESQLNAQIKDIEKQSGVNISRQLAEHAPNVTPLQSAATPSATASPSSEPSAQTTQPPISSIAGTQARLEEARNATQMAAKIGREQAIAEHEAKQAQAATTPPPLPAETIHATEKTADIAPPLEFAKGKTSEITPETQARIDHPITQAEIPTPQPAPVQPEAPKPPVIEAPKEAVAPVQSNSQVAPPTPSLDTPQAPAVPTPAPKIEARAPEPVYQNFTAIQENLTTTVGNKPQFIHTEHRESQIPPPPPKVAGVVSKKDIPSQGV